MLWLIKADLTSTGKLHLRNGTPSCLLHIRALNTFLRERSHLGIQVVAHEIEFVRTILIGRVECGLSQRQCKDEPAVSRIRKFEPEDVTKKCAVSIGVFAIENYVSARNHLPPRTVRCHLQRQ